MKKYNVIDLFAGAGGLSNGFEQTDRYEVIAACEMNEKARITYKLNHINNSYFEKDVAKVDYLNVIKGINDDKYSEELKDITWTSYKEIVEKTGAKKIDIIIGGPPCQGFSNANRQRNHLVSSNNELVKEYIRLIKEINPVAFVMENVRGFASDKHKFFQADSNKKEFIGLREEEKTHVENFHIDSLPVFVKALHADIFNRTGFGNFLLSKRSYTTLNVLYKVKDDKKKLKKEVERKASDIKAVKKEMKEWILDYPKSIYGLELMNQMNQFFRVENVVNDLYITTLSNLVVTQRLFNKLQELVDHKIVINAKDIEVQQYEVIIDVESTTVMDYVTNALGAQYTLGKKVLKAVEFGVPQYRERFIMMGVRRDIIDEEALPMPEGDPNKAVTVDEALCDLRNIRPYKECTDQTLKTNGEENEYLRLMQSIKRHPGRVSNHINTDSGKEAKKRFEVLKEGGNFHSLSEDLKTTYSQPERTQSSIYLKLKRDKPSNTVTNVRKSMWVSPYKPRALSIREAARLQSFNDDFLFAGTKDAQYQQVGNAVPPLLAKAIGIHLIKLLEDVDN